MTCTASMRATSSREMMPPAAEMSLAARSASGESGSLRTSLRATFVSKMQSAIAAPLRRDDFRGIEAVAVLREHGRSMLRDSCQRFLPRCQRLHRQPHMGVLGQVDFVERPELTIHVFRINF